MSEVRFMKWCLIPFAFIWCLFIGIFALLNWQNASVAWACPIAFILGVVSLILAGMCLTMWVLLLVIEKYDDEA